MPIIMRGKKIFGINYFISWVEILIIFLLATECTNDHMKMVCFTAFNHNQLKTKKDVIDVNIKRNTTNNAII